MERVPQSGRKSVLGFLLGVGVFASFALAQLPTATILGVVKDASGAVVPGASLTARNTETGQTRTAVSAGDGSYRFSALPVGSYEVRVEQSGFQTEVRSGFTLTVAQEAVINFTLQVGAVTQTVAVTAEAPLVNTTSGSVGALVSEQQVSDLPLNGRNFADLTLLQPGVVQHRCSSCAVTFKGSLFSANGMPLRSNYFLLDGAPMGDVFTGDAASSSNSTLGIEGIREWRVVTNSVSAEYGMRMGAQVTLVSKGGTNSFHGSLFEFLRNSALDARNFFDYPSAAVGPDFRLPAFRRNQYGGSFGGPIKKDKAFFHATYEGLKERLGLTNIVDVPGAGCHGAAGAVITNAACPQLGTVAAVPIAPVVAPLLELYPLPNLPGNRFTFSSTRPTDEHYGQIRGDYTVSENDAAFVRFTADRTAVIAPLAFPQFRDDLTSGLTLLTLADTHIFSSALVGTFRASFSRSVLLANSPSDLIGPQYSFVPGGWFGNISVGGFTGIGTTSFNPNHSKLNTFTYSGDLFYTKGRHSFKFGALFARQQLYTLGSGSTRGSVTFANLSSFLQGQTSTYTALSRTRPDRTYHYNLLGFYVQDDFRALPNLTFNLGLRHEFHTDVNEVYGNGVALRDIHRDAAFTPGLAFQNPSLKSFGPRFGFAWDVRGDGKTAVRGGFAEMFDIGNVGSLLIISKGGQPPLLGLSTVTTPGTLSLPLFFPPAALGKLARTVDYNLRQTHMLSYNLTVERQLPANIAVSLAYAGSRGLNLIKNPNANPTIPTVRDGQLFWTGTEPRFNPNWTQGMIYSASADSWYNSLQFVVTKRLSQGLEFNSAYTWAKLIDTCAQVSSAGEAGGSRCSTSTVIPNEYDKGLADWNVSHSWRFSAIYRLPERTGLGGLAGGLLNGWWTSGILTTQTGLPLTTYLSAIRSRRGEAAGLDRPNLAPGRSNDNIVSGTTDGCTGVAAGQKLGTPNLYFDPCAFSIPAAGFLGNLGRDTLTAPGLFNLDFSLVKDTALPFFGESGKLQFRAEIFNILNRANFSRPAFNVFAGTADVQAPLPNAGQITRTDTTSRQLQFALKIVF